MLDMETLVFGTGLLLGAAALTAVYYVWIRSHTFGMGGSLLSLVGVMLVGMSLWSSVEFTLPGGTKAQFQRMQTEIDSVRQATAQVSRAVEEAREDADAAQAAVLSLDVALRALPVQTQISPERDSIIDVIERRQRRRADIVPPPPVLQPGGLDF